MANMDMSEEDYKIYSEGNYKLDPQCFKDEMSFAVTNRGHLIPCCRCDDPFTMEDPKFKKLLSVSKIDRYESIDEIIRQKEWLDFMRDLENHKGPHACFFTCRQNKAEDSIQTLEVLDPETKEVVDEVER